VCDGLFFNCQTIRSGACSGNDAGCWEPETGLVMHQRFLQCKIHHKSDQAFLPNPGIY